ncbi:hypothetical protein B0T26DRAFT_716938 [Lasiosphaeria miniovina]|uniref:Uncharacterized protein n=1 Tax=Lasiosphaeria miniovina TaxID=1954250 RepID=A0AA40ACJ7_9PEZI|nr:uncharacterized protein B0T26DRAFT_716938 [Lasiosphaeria miniovina]KAK0713274.1 hypothetical protein B0T26DRAFT_716938 [Lasiosphaeria miniovina]
MTVAVLASSRQVVWRYLGVVHALIICDLLHLITRLVLDLTLLDNLIFFFVFVPRLGHFA